MKISLIAAIARDRGVGKDNKLLVHLPPDLKHFKQKTSGHMVIMGQTTYESIGRPLPNRVNVVLSKDKNFKADGCVVLFSIEDVIAFARNSNDEEVFFIGGASIYKQAIKFADKLYLTLIEETYLADTFFPDYSEFSNKIYQSEVYQYKGTKYSFIELIKS